VFICGLDGDRDRQPFGQMLSLIPYATEYHKLTAKCQICKDGTDASFTLDTQQNAKTKTQIVVGTTQYLPVCRQHYLELHHSD
jgi:thymidine kinase